MEAELCRATLVRPRFVGKQSVGSADRDRLFRTLYLDHAGRLSAFAYRCGVPRDDIDDVISEVFLIAWRKLDAIPDPPVDRLWLFGVARNVIAKQRHGRWRQVRLVDRLTVLPGAVDAGAVGDQMALRDAIGRLPVRERDVVRLVEWEGLSHDEVAVIVGCSANASRIRLHRAKVRLRRELRDASREEEGE
jgi:RNA polymerase sigma factor (sigma-70 family)